MPVFARKRPPATRVYGNPYQETPYTEEYSQIDEPALRLRAWEDRVHNRMDMASKISAYQPQTPRLAFFSSAGLYSSPTTRKRRR